MNTINDILDILRQGNFYTTLLNTIRSGDWELRWGNFSDKCDDLKQNIFCPDILGTERYNLYLSKTVKVGSLNPFSHGGVDFTTPSGIFNSSTFC